jgi:hypothetical protein
MSRERTHELAFIALLSREGHKGLDEAAYPKELREGSGLLVAAYEGDLAPPILPTTVPAQTPAPLFSPRPTAGGRQPDGQEHGGALLGSVQLKPHRTKSF